MIDSDGITDCIAVLVGHEDIEFCTAVSDRRVIQSDTIRIIEHHIQIVEVIDTDNCH